MSWYLPLLIAGYRLTPLPKPCVFTSIQELVNAQMRSRGNQDIQCIARSVDGSQQFPSAKAIRVCQNVARYTSGNMEPDEFERKKESIDKAMDANKLQLGFQLSE